MTDHPRAPQSRTSDEDSGLPPPGGEAVADAVAELAEGQPIVVVNSWRGLGLVGLPAGDVTPERINFLVRECRGIVYVGLEADHLERIGIPRQDTGTGAGGLQRTFQLRMPVDLRAGVTTGVSAADRAATIAALLDPTTTAQQYRMPGHVTPMDLHRDGVIGRLGLTEAVQDLSFAAGRGEGVVVCAVLDEDGREATPERLVNFAHRWQMPLVTLTDVVRHRRLRGGWQTAGPSVTGLELPFIDARAAVHVVGGHRILPTFPVTALDLCIPGQVLDSGCPCGDRHRRAVEALRNVPAGAVCVVWAPEDPVPACPASGGRGSMTAAVAQLVGAMYAAAERTPDLLADVDRI